MQPHDKSWCYKGYFNTSRAGPEILEALGPALPRTGSEHKKHRNDHLTNTAKDHDNGSYTPTTVALGCWIVHGARTVAGHDGMR
ncbi:hypothetical protein F2Q70_00042188 [Brassica cretica]|uniref:Uncharacterized protein n=1 Tax=Brassica cretica TaxID=69181 RepID=A0A8S9K948_BRACR|nr:hypothetical protein F2Q70_00042188 [Brassica cretica]KAF2619859.1 hypothetical protein F2Q68_00042847 [Brassica cretica]